MIYKDLGVIRADILYQEILEVGVLSTLDYDNANMELHTRHTTFQRTIQLPRELVKNILIGAIPSCYAIRQSNLFSQTQHTHTHTHI